MFGSPSKFGSSCRTLVATSYDEKDKNTYETHRSIQNLPFSPSKFGSSCRTLVATSFTTKKIKTHLKHPEDLLNYCLINNSILNNWKLEKIPKFHINHSESLLQIYIAQMQLLKNTRKDDPRQHILYHSSIPITKKYLNPTLQNHANHKHDSNKIRKPKLLQTCLQIQYCSNCIRKSFEWFHGIFL